MIPRLGRSLVIACLSLTSLAAQDYDCRTGMSGVSFFEVFRQVAEGLDYTDDGEIIRASGKNLPLNDSTRIAFFHYVARVRPTVSVPLYVRCDACEGKGGQRGLFRDPNSPLDLGQLVDVRCGKCNGVGGSKQNTYLTVTYSGPLPPLPASPKLRRFRDNLAEAKDGSALAQLAVAQVYLEGQLVPRDLVAARDWYTKAAAQGEREAIAPLAGLYVNPDAPFRDHAFGFALRAVADSTDVKAETPGFLDLGFLVNDGLDLATGIARHLQGLEAGLLAPHIARGLQDKATAEKVLSPDQVRRSFPSVGVLPAPDTVPARVLFVQGLARYFGFGYASPDPAEGLRLIDASACQADPRALLFVAFHFDSGKSYPASAPAAWAFYSVASALGAKDPFVARRTTQLAEVGVAADWAEVPDILREHLIMGKLAPASLRELSDLSRYRAFLSAAGPAVAAGPYAVATTQETPLSRAQVFARARSMLDLKLSVVSVAPDDVSYFRKCWDDGQARFYAVSGIVTFTDAGARRETAPYTVCFKVTDPASPPTLLYCSAGSFVYGEYPVECSRRP